MNRTSKAFSETQEFVLSGSLRAHCQWSNAITYPTFLQLVEKSLTQDVRFSTGGSDSVGLW